MLKQILNALYRLRNWAKIQASQEALRVSWGYGYCKTESDEKAREYLHAVKLLRDQELSAGACICEEEIDRLLSGASKVVGPECGDGSEVDFTRKQRDDHALWVLQNPGCVAYETWAEYLQAMCKRLNVDVRAIELKCSSLDLDVKVAEKVACSQVELLLQIEQLSCAVGVDISVEAYEACRVTAEVEVMPLTCGLSLNTAVKALACGISLGMLVSTFGCDVSLNPVVTPVDPCPPDSTEMNSATAVCKPGCSCDDIDCGSPCPALLQDKPGPPEADVPSLVEFVIPDIMVKCGDCEFTLPASVWENVNFAVAVDLGEILIGTGAVALGDLVSCADPQYAECCASGYTATLSIASVPVDPPVTINDCEYRTLTVTFTDSCGNTVVCSRPWGDITC